MTYLVLVGGIIVVVALAVVGRTRSLAGFNALAERPVFGRWRPLPEPPLGELADRPLSELDYVVLDTETTGLRPSDGDEIVQLAGIRISRGEIRRDRVFDTLVDPGRPIPEPSIRFHGITDDMVRGMPRITEVLPAFRVFCDGAVLVAHNAAFDLKFLQLKQDRAGVCFDMPVLDTLLLSAVLEEGEREHGLDAMTARFGIEVKNRHSALGDAEATAAAFLRLVEIAAANGVTTLADAVKISAKARQFRRLQRQY